MCPYYQGLKRTSNSSTAIMDYTANFKGHGSGHAVHKGKISTIMTMQNDNEYINPN